MNCTHRALALQEELAKKEEAWSAALTAANERHSADCSSPELPGNGESGGASSGKDNGDTTGGGGGAGTGGGAAEKALLISQIRSLEEQLQLKEEAWTQAMEHTMEELRRLRGDSQEENKEEGAAADSAAPSSKHDQKRLRGRRKS
jgi:hypothetical protein